MPISTLPANNAVGSGEPFGSLYQAWPLLIDT
jgi:hypothetical protein